MLVSAKDMLNKAKAGKYAVGQFNINNLEWTKAILQTAEELKSPVILGVSEGAGKYMCGYTTIVGMVNSMIELMSEVMVSEKRIDRSIYESLLEFRDKDKVDIKKKRYYFVYEGGYLHLDMFDGDDEMILAIWCNELFDKEKPDTYFKPVSE